MCPNINTTLNLNSSTQYTYTVSITSESKNAYSFERCLSNLFSKNEITKLINKAKNKAKYECSIIEYTKLFIGNFIHKHTNYSQSYVIKYIFKYSK